MRMIFENIKQQKIFGFYEMWWHLRIYKVFYNPQKINIWKQWKHAEVYKEEISEKTEITLKNFL